MASLFPHRLTNQGYGWKPDLPDLRDRLFEPAPDSVAKLPAKVDLRDTGKLTTPYDQLQLGSCTANAIGGAIEFQQGMQGQSQVRPSRLFIYYNERYMEGTVSSDSGAAIRDGMKACHIVGAAPESAWPYDPARFSDEPPTYAYKDGLNDVVLGYHRVSRDANHMKASLAAKRPVVVGFTVYESFEEDVTSNGIMPMPVSSERVVGGHAVLTVGYTTINAAPYWIVRNSWGPKWGDGGYFYMPEAYLTNRRLSGDFWAITMLGKKAA